MKQAIIGVAILAVCFAVVSNLQAERPGVAEKAAYLAAHPDAVESSGPAVRPVGEPVTTELPKSSRAPGTITYDDGTYHSAPGVSSNCYGNQFNTWSGNPVMASGSVTALDFFMASVSGNVFLSVYGPVSGTTAPQLTSVSVPPTAGAMAWNHHTFTSPLAYTGSSFLAGVWYYVGDAVGLATGTVGGQGHHGMLINDGTTGTGFAPLSTVNAMVRASGNVLPVELMNFTIQ